MAYRLVADWKDAAVREVGALMAPRVLGLAAAQVNFYFIAIFFASTLGAGAISAVSFAWLIVMTPLGVIGMAISTAAFPTLADQAARDDDEMPRTLSRALRLILYLSLPAGVGLMLLAEPIVVVLLQRGAFDAESTELTAQALTYYAIALFAHSGIEILSRGFYALGDTRTPVGIAIAAMLLNLALTAVLIGPLEVRGLGLALSVATSLEFVALLAVLSRRLPGFVDKGFGGSILRMLIATGLMTGAVLAAIYLLRESAGLETHDTGEAFALVAVCAALGAAVYLAASLALRLSEPALLLSRLPLLRRLTAREAASP
jgi:putative peptidoglycan lipid II flippase